MNDRLVKMGSPALGYTVLELLVTLAVLALLAAVAIPSFDDSIQRNARDSAVLDLMSSLSLARSEAVNASSTVSICRSTNQTACAAAGDWAAGWLIFVDADGDGALDTGEEILQGRSALDGQAAITLANGGGTAMAFLSYDREGFLGNSSNGATYKFCSADNQAADARAVWVANTGRASRSLDDADGVHNDIGGANLSCP